MPAPQAVGLLKQKGGSGAATVGGHLAMAAARGGGQKVCPVDLDPRQSAVT